MNFAAGLLPLDAALEQMLAQLTPITDNETIPLLQAFGRVTAQAVISPLDVPGFDNSAMDGYAVRCADVAPNVTLSIAGKAFAGQPFWGNWPAGSCVRIMTGAPIPEGCDAVVMQEETEEVDGGIRLVAGVQTGQNIRRRGEDIGKGNSVLNAGCRLSAAELPLLASLGIADISVVRKPRVAVFSTGDELQLPGQPLGAGQIYDTNRLAVHIMLEQLGCEVINLGIVRDDPTALRETFRRADSDNPVSAAATFYQLVQPLLTKLSGCAGSGLGPRMGPTLTSALACALATAACACVMKTLNSCLRTFPSGRAFSSLMSR